MVLMQGVSYSCCVILLGVLTEVCVLADPPRFSHEEWTRVLSHFVDERGFVDYQALAEQREVFDSYIAKVVSTGPETHPELFATREEQLAYYINAYNAMVFDGVLDRGPEEESVWKGGLISGYRFFVKRKITLGGRKLSLRSLENDVVRRDFKDPRVHAALNCASISCPRLPQEAFDPERLNEQLDDAISEFVSEARNVTVEPSSRTIWLSKIFDWFESDFLDYERVQGSGRPSVLGYVNRYRDPDSRLPQHYRIRYVKYDKGVNKQR